MIYYELKEPLLDLPKGTVFIHVAWSQEVPEWGNKEWGAMILAWNKGGYQGGWTGGAFVLPGQYSENECFRRIKNKNGQYTLPTTHPAVCKKTSKEVKTCALIDICKHFTPDCNIT